MATLDYSEIKPRKYILVNDEPYEVLESHVARTQKRKPQNQVRLKSLINGKIVPMTFHASETAEEADILRKNIKYLYNNKGEYWFSDIDNPKDRFKLDDNIINENKKWLKDNEEIEALVFDDGDKEKIIGIKVPIKMTLLIVECPPNVKGNSSGGVNKLATLETGAQVLVPVFIEQGEKIIVNTETGEYSERA